MTTPGWAAGCRATSGWPRRWAAIWRCTRISAVPCAGSDRAGPVWTWRRPARRRSTRSTRPRHPLRARPRLVDAAPPTTRRWPGSAHGPPAPARTAAMPVGIARIFNGATGTKTRFYVALLRATPHSIPARRHPPPGNCPDAQPRVAPCPPGKAAASSLNDNSAASRCSMISCCSTSGAGRSSRRSRLSSLSQKTSRLAFSRATKSS